MACKDIEEDSKDCGEAVEYGTNNEEDTCHDTMDETENEDEDGGSGCADEVADGNTKSPDGMANGLHPVWRLKIGVEGGCVVWSMRMRR